MMNDRRDFIKKVSLGAGALAFSGLAENTSFSLPAPDEGKSENLKH